MHTRVALVTFSYVVAAIAVAACGDGKSDPPPGSEGTSCSGICGTVTFGVTAVNAGANAKLHLPPQAAPIRSPLAVATHTIDPSTYPVKQSLAGPPDEMILTIRKIEADGPSGPQKLFGTDDGSGPGVDIQLTNGAVDLTTTGLILDPIPTGHYTRALVWVSRSVKMRGCVDGLFAAEAAVAGTYNGQTYTTDALAAGTHRFCTIASNSLLSSLPSTDAPVGSDADFEAQTTGELTEFDLAAGVGGQSAQDVRDATATIPLATEFDVGADTPTKLTPVIDMNRMLRFWPNILTVLGFQPPQPQGYPPGTSYFYLTSFERSLAIFAGEPGSIEGYQVISEVCQDVNGNCVAGAPPDSLAKEWLTLVRNPNGTIVAGEIQPDDTLGAFPGGDIVPTGVVAGVTGTFTLPFGLYRVTTETNGTIDGFRFQSLGDPEDSCTVNPIQHQGPVDGHGPFPFWYTRRL
jgi:hypothetical protein